MDARGKGARDDGETWRGDRKSSIADDAGMQPSTVGEARAYADETLNGLVLSTAHKCNLVLA